MPDIDISFDGRFYSVVVEDGSEDRVHDHVRTIERYAKELKAEHGRIERSLLVLLAGIQALDDARDASDREVIWAMNDTTVTLREAAGRISLLADRMGR